MDIRPLSPALAVSAQVGLGDIEALAEFGFRSLIVNLPDGEVADHPGFESIAAEAMRHGLVARYLPVRPGQVGVADVNQFRSLLHSLPGPVLACCRTGKRSAMLWSALERQNGQTVAGILSVVRKAGYDLSDFLRGKSAA